MIERLMPTEYAAREWIGEDGRSRFNIVIREMRPGRPHTWAVVDDLRNCLNRDGELEHEPMPSSRDDAFLARCRFASPEEALAALYASTDEYVVSTRRPPPGA